MSHEKIERTGYTDDRFIRLTTVYRMTDALHLRDVLETAGIPYITQNKSPYQAYVQDPNVGPQDFSVPERDFNRALDALHELFEVRPVESDIFKNCPACQAEVRPGSTTCPDCGLFLG